MGTSKSYGGPSDRPALLPSWALPPENSLFPDLPVGPEPDETSDGGSRDGSSDGSPDGESTSPSSNHSQGPWTSSRRGMTSLASHGGSGRLSRAAGRYVAA